MRVRIVLHLLVVLILTPLTASLSEASLTQQVAAPRPSAAVSAPARTIPGRASRERLALTPRQYAATLVPAQAFACLDTLWERESQWNPNEQNHHTSAYGIAQFLDSTWADTGIAKTAVPEKQVDAGLRYIRSRYGEPCSALRHSNHYNWY